MKNLTKILLGAASLMATATVAMADDAPPPPDWALVANVAVQSDYRFRGITQNDKSVTPEGTLGFTGPDGFYGNLWAAKTNWGVARASGGTNNPSFELDEYVGKHTDLWGTDLNVEAYYYSYPDFHLKGSPKASFFEVITQLTHAFGPLTVVGTWAYSPEFSLGGGTGNYLEGTGTFAVNDWLSISGNVGHQWVQNAKYNGSSDYSHFDIGATATYKTFALDARYVATDLKKSQCGFYMGTSNACSGGFMATLTFTPGAFPW
jgi:uncharacterized protein (TIGR02001 family)